MAKPRPYLGVYENMDFPDYKFQEYPKVVGYADAKKTQPIVVKDQREEVDFLTRGQPGAVKTREEELHDELERKNIELELAKQQLAEINKAKAAGAVPAAKKAEVPAADATPAVKA
jgi:hypothetical protein